MENKITYQNGQMLYIYAEKIIFGGGVFGPAVKFIDRIYEEAVQWGQPISMKQVKFEPSQLSGNAGLIGAGYLALKNG